VEDRVREITGPAKAPRTATRGRRRVAESVLLAGLLVAGVRPFSSPAAAKPLDREIPDLFGGVLITTIDRGAQLDQQEVRVAERFRNLSAALAAARSQAPIPSASGAFRFAWDPELDTFVRQRQTLGSAVAERAQTLGRNTFTFAASYTRIDFNTLEGDRLSHLRSSQPALSPSFLAQLPPSDQVRFANDILETRLDLAFGFDLFYLSAAYGLTDSIDLSIALSLNRARMRARATASILDCSNGKCDAPGDAVFGEDQVGLITDSTVCEPLHCAADRFDSEAFGTGDLFLRGKWNFAETQWADLALAGVLTLPTGNASDFLGFHDPTFTPWLVASRNVGPILSPHVNLGYAFRSGKDVSQAQWIVGSDLLAAEWLTLNVDFLGYHDDRRDGVNDDIFQSALGFKLHPFGQAVLAGSFQLPLNREGLRADVVYTLQVEVTF
jgi:hypothetical protein